MNKKALSTIMTIALIGGAGIFGLMWHNAGFVATDDARVAASLVPVSANSSGVLERFQLQEGQMVSANDILGWVYGAEVMRVPVSGLVTQTNVVQGQHVSAAAPMAVISEAGSVHIQADIEETDILSIYLGQRVYVSVDTFGRQRFSGYVSGIGSVALPYTGLTSSRATLTIPVEINVTDDVDLNRLIGVNASVRIPLR